jgi:hypothetical protein
MKIYHYNEEGRFVGDSQARQDPRDEGNYLIPLNATITEPPKEGLNEVAIFENGNWQIKPYYRGTWYSKDTKEQVTFDIGDTPNITDFTHLEPPSHEHIFIKDKWVLKETLKKVTEKKLAELENFFKEISQSIIAGTDFSKQDLVFKAMCDVQNLQVKKQNIKEIIQGLKTINQVKDYEIIF